MQNPLKLVQGPLNLPARSSNEGPGSWGLPSVHAPDSHLRAPFLCAKLGPMYTPQLFQIPPEEEKTIFIYKFSQATTQTDASLHCY